MRISDWSSDVCSSDLLMSSLPSSSSVRASKVKLTPLNSQRADEARVVLDRVLSGDPLVDLGEREVRTAGRLRAHALGVLLLDRFHPLRLLELSQRLPLAPREGVAARLVRLLVGLSRLVVLGVLLL